MATVKGLMVLGNNQTKGHSAFTMTHPGLFNDLDYPDVASLACPKPMLFFAGEQDKLFPVPSVKFGIWLLRGINHRAVLHGPRQTERAGAGVCGSSVLRFGPHQNRCFPLVIWVSQR